MWEEYPHENFEIHPDQFIDKMGSNEEVHFSSKEQKRDRITTQHVNYGFLWDKTTIVMF